MGLSPGRSQRAKRPTMERCDGCGREWEYPASLRMTCVGNPRVAADWRALCATCRDAHEAKVKPTELHL